MTGELLSARNLDAGYDSRTIVRDLDLRALKGQVIGLIGPNGAGKSTILRTLAGLLAPVRGTVYLGGEPLGGIKPPQKARQIAVVLTDRLGIPLTSAYEVASMGRTPYTGFFGRLSGEDHRIVRECLERVDALDLADRSFLSLSDGEKQKVLIARALAQEPELIILDEPTSHLDIRHKIEVLGILNALAREKALTVIMAMHDIDLAVKCCEILLLVKGGRIVAQGKSDAVISGAVISGLYDIAGAAYDSVLGSIELCNERDPEVFVVAGAGSGAPVFRMISRLGFGIASGILHRNDIDHAVASLMKLTILEAESFQPIGPEALGSGAALIRGAAFVVDAGFPLGELNRENLGLVEQGLRMGKPCFSMRDSQDIRALYGDMADALIRVSSVSDLEGRIKKIK